MIVLLINTTTCHARYVHLTKLSLSLQCTRAFFICIVYLLHLFIHYVLFHKQFLTCTEEHCQNCILYAIHQNLNGRKRKCVVGKLKTWIASVKLYMPLTWLSVSHISTTFNLIYLKWKLVKWGKSEVLHSRHVSFRFPFYSRVRAPVGRD